MHLFKKINKGCFAKNSLYFFTLFLLLSSSKCKTDANNYLTSKEWYVDNTHYAKTSKVGNISYYVVRFFPDGTFALFTGSGFAFGRWLLATDKMFIQLHPNFGDLKMLDLFWKLEEKTINEMTIGLYPEMSHDENKKDITIQCVGITNSSDQDPFSINENKWRKRPQTSETEEQLKSHVVSYLHFLEALYQHTFDNKLNELRYDWFPQPLRMEYSNGVRMAYSGEEMALWNKCFYDSAQAVKAYQLVGGAMYNIKLKKTDNIADRNIDFVQQMIRHLK